jgi:cell wall-associated NlpC family hydrolase
MSMIDWFNRPKENPWESARRFRQGDPLASRRIGQAEEAVEDPLQDRFTPEQIQQPMTAGEQAFEQRMAEADEMAAQETQNVMQLAEVERAARDRENFSRMQRDAQSNVGYGAHKGYGPDFEIPGELSGTRENVVRKAGSFLGSPYQLGGKTVKGIDCSGLVMSVYGQAGIDVSQHSAGWQGRNIPGARTSVSNLQPGDIVAWKDGSHIAIYAGNGMIIDSSRRRGTSYRKLWAPEGNVYGIKLRFPGE